MFVDQAQITIKSGKGGNGAVSFRREPFVPQGGPDGGNGGRGGDIIIRADRNLRTLMDFRYKRKYEAENGEDGRGKKQFGKDGADLVIRVPMGTIVRDLASGKVMADLRKDGESFVAARGGRGGRGNVCFKSSVRQAPNFAEAGGFPQELAIELELKLLADVGLVGYPNVGKSTLLSVATSANPKIANYPFTTLTPNLGVVSVYDESFVMADIPGLIEGASEGQGLGLDFLKHVERTRVLVHVVDVSASEGRDPIEDFETINRELAGYGRSLTEKPQIVAANKIDLASQEAYDRFASHMQSRGYPVFPVCAPTAQGVGELLAEVCRVLKQTETPEEPEPIAPYESVAPEEAEDYRRIDLRREDGVFVVSGKQLEKIFNSTNFNDTGSLRYLYRYIEERGVIDRLLEMGLQEGDTIRMFDYEFEYYEDEV